MDVDGHAPPAATPAAHSRKRKKSTSSTGRRQHARGLGAGATVPARSPEPSAASSASGSSISITSRSNSAPGAAAPAVRAEPAPPVARSSSEIMPLGQQRADALPVDASTREARRGAQDLAGVFFNEDCIAGSAQHISDECVDCIVTDPPFGIGGESLDKHYNRNESHVLPGYHEVASDNYGAWTADWVAEAARVLVPGGRLLVVSGYTHLTAVLAALNDSKNRLCSVAHLIWKRTFGVHTTRKYVSSHYHVLVYEKQRQANASASGAAGPAERPPVIAGPLATTPSVLFIKRKNQPGKTKNKNQLPKELLQILLKIGTAHCSPGALVADFFLGSFSTAREALELGFNVTGFEINEEAFKYQQAHPPTRWPDWRVTGDVSADADTAGSARPDDKSKCLDDRADLSHSLAHPAKVRSPLDEARPVVLPSAGEREKIRLVVSLVPGVLSEEWLRAVSSRLHKDGSMYLVVSAEHLHASLQELAKVENLVLVNHIIWLFSNQCLEHGEGHVHVLFLENDTSSGRVFNMTAFFPTGKRKLKGRVFSPNYAHREDVWSANGQPLGVEEVVEKAIRYSSDEHHTVADFAALGETKTIVQCISERLKRDYITM